MMAAMPQDLWSQFLNWLSTIIVPDWGALVAAIPLLGVIGLLGPILTILALAWVRHRLTRRAGRIRLGEVLVRGAPRDALGVPVIPANVPFCVRDSLVYPGSATRCTTCGDGLVVRCPVDDTVRPATRQTCAACGTRYVLSDLPALVAPQQAGPPPGGAAAA